MRSLITDSGDWRRVWTEGRSQLIVEHEPDGTVRIVVHDVEWPGYGMAVDSVTAAEIATFIGGGGR